MNWVIANWQMLVTGIIAVGELVSLFIPKSSGTLKGIITALAGLPGVKDPKIGQ